MKTTFILAFACLISLCSPLALQANLIDTTNQPTIGNAQAPVQVVAFLEPKCPDSKKFYNESFPKLKSEFIDTNNVRFSVVTTSFLFKSMPAALALLCAYHQDPKTGTDLFFSYLSYIYKNQPPEREDWATMDTLAKFATNANKSIDIERLKQCIQKGHFKSEIEKNTALGNDLMGHLTTPSLFVNGVRIESSEENFDYAKLKKAIQQALSKQQAK